MDAGNHDTNMVNMSDAAIVVEGVTKTFPTTGILRKLVGSGSRPGGSTALRGVSLHVDEGEVLGLLGPNGAGKTTLLEILSTLLLPTSGRARLGGYDVMTQAAQARRVTSYCGSTLQAFYPRLTGAENLEFFAVLNDLPPRQAREQLRDALNLVGLTDAAHTTFQRYSDGMKQRLALARALLTAARIVLLDEPTKGLDPRMQVEMQRFLRRTLVERLGCTVLLVTHSVAEAEAVCDRVAILQRGVIVRVGKPREVSRWAAGGGHLSEVLPGAAAAAG